MLVLGGAIGILVISYYNNPYENGWYDPLSPTNRNVDHWLVDSYPYHSLSWLITINCHYTDWLIGIFIMAYYYPYATGWYHHPRSNRTNRGEMITAAVISKVFLGTAEANLVANV